MTKHLLTLTTVMMKLCQMIPTYLKMITSHAQITTAIQKLEQKISLISHVKQIILYSLAEQQQE